MPGLRRGTNSYKKRLSWRPGENTIAYYPFENDILDHSGNNKDFTGSGYTLRNGTVTVPTGTSLTGGMIVPSSGTGDRTIMAWLLSDKSSYSYADGQYGTNGFIHNNSSENRSGACLKLGSTWYNDPISTPFTKSMVHIAAVKSGTSFKVYKDGELITNMTLNTDQWYEQYATTISKLNEGTFGEIIVESVGWTQEEIRDYLNKNSYKYTDYGAGYQAVEYIESSGTQYIDTLYNPIYGTKIACKFMHNEHVLDTPVFGRRQSGGSYEYTLRSHPSEFGRQGAVRYNIMSANGISINSYPQGTIIEFEYDKSSYKYGSQTGSISPSTSNVTGINLIMFGLREGSSIDSRKFSGRMYYFTIWENGTLVRDFVPCYRKSDNKIGLYDLVNDQFYTNAGTGTFTKGGDI